MSDTQHSIYSIFGTDKNIEQTGFLLTYPGSKFIIARAGGANRSYTTFMEQQLRPHRKAVERGHLDDEIANTILREAFARHIVLSWEGVKNPEDMDLPIEEQRDLEFTPENCVALFLALPDLFEDIRDQSTTLANFIQEQRDEDAKS